MNNDDQLSNESCLKQDKQVCLCDFLFKCNLTLNAIIFGLLIRRYFVVAHFVQSTFSADSQQPGGSK